MLQRPVEPALPGTEDFSYVSEKVPSLYVFLGTGDHGWPYVHTPDMRQDESAFKYGAALHAHIATSWLARHSGSGRSTPPSPQP